MISLRIMFITSHFAYHWSNWTDVVRKKKKLLESSETVCQQVGLREEVQYPQFRYNIASSVLDHAAQMFSEVNPTKKKKNPKTTTVIDPVPTLSVFRYPIHLHYFFFHHMKTMIVVLGLLPFIYFVGGE